MKAPRAADGLILTAVVAVFAFTHANSTAGNALIGKKAPEWKVEHWLNSKRLALKDLEGKVVLVRWWTGPGCPYCSSTAPSLNHFHEKYAKDGLVVIGFYHHKSREPLSLAKVKRLAEGYGFEFPIAVDPSWQSLKKWWLDSGMRSFTSVSFLIDRDGIIRHIHTGGQYVKGDKAYALMESKIAELLGE